MPEDLVFTIKEKTAPNFFPEILVPPRAVSSRGPNHRGEAGSGDGGNDGERGMAVVLSSDLTQCLGGSPPGKRFPPGVGTPPAADQGLGEQSGGFSGLRPRPSGCSPCLHLHRGHNSHNRGRENKYFC